VADFLARRKGSQLIQAIRANQWVIRGECLDGAALDHAVRETLHHSARCVFDLYHYMHDSDGAGELIVLEPSFQEISRRPEFDRRGLMIIGLHLSNFDLVLQRVAAGGMKLMAVTIPNPQGGRQLEYEIRRRTGINMLPASVSAFRQALKHLQAGGTVLTGIDRPIPDPQPLPRFFGRPAAVPVHSIFLATKARVPVMITMTSFQQDGKYHVCASEPLEMDPGSDAETALLRNAEKVLRVAEGYIRRAPQQWSVPLPVWPDIMNCVPM
jgi:KDO2-lipid IV(A) lauroyltransferase